MKLVTIALMATLITTPVMSNEHTTTDCLIETAGGATIGLVAGATVGVVSSILLAPLTAGGSLLALPVFFGAGAKGGVIWGTAAGAGTCAYNEVNEGEEENE